MSLAQRRILLVLSGGIAAYKVLDLIRLLRKAGAQVQCVMTPNATQFVTPLSVAALSGNPALSDMWANGPDQQIDHIRLTREADLVVVAPATANLIAKMACGLADDLASTLLLASNKPLYVAPAMNVAMWQHPATQANMKILRQRGVKVIGPEKGAMACAEDGEGRMTEPTSIFAVLQNHFEKTKPLAGRKALVTSGPTYEPLDPVRFIGNRSSGKQGHALAQVLAEAGAETVLVTGPTALADPVGVKTIHIETAREMMAACEQNLAFVDIAICAAAVADWRPATVSDCKMKKHKSKGSVSETPALALVENPDILATIAQHPTERPALVIGFAAETDHVKENAQDKFARKGCDWILANQVGKDKGFAKDENTITFLTRTNGALQSENWPQLSKTDIATRLVAHIAEHIELMVVQTPRLDPVSKCG